MYNLQKSINIKPNFIGQDSKRFARSVAQLVRKHFDEKIFPTYKTTKTKSFFQLKAPTPVSLSSCVVYL